MPVNHAAVVARSLLGPLVKWIVEISQASVRSLQISRNFDFESASGYHFLHLVHRSLNIAERDRGSYSVPICTGCRAPHELALVENWLAMNKKVLWILQLELNEAAADAFGPLFLQRCTTDEINLLVKGNRKTEAGLQRRISRCYIITPVPITDFTAQTLKGMKTGWASAEITSSSQHLIIKCAYIFGGHKELPAEFTNKG